MKETHEKIYKLINRISHSYTSLHLNLNIIFFREYVELYVYVSTSVNIIYTEYHLYFRQKKNLIALNQLKRYYVFSSVRFRIE